MEQSHPFDKLTPDFVMDAVEACGYQCDCRTFALNSYENRVYQVGVEDHEPLIAKFYRPDRWSVEQILEEHQFCFDLVEQELPVVAPWRNGTGESLFVYGPFHYALFPRRGGHAPEFDNLDNLLVLGRFMGRIHLQGRRRDYRHRPRLDCNSFGRVPVDLIREQFIPSEYRDNYAASTAALLSRMEQIVGDIPDLKYIRGHGDCHSGNILWRNDSLWFVDFDDTRMAPAIQDLWMLLSGDRPRQEAQLQKILEGYMQFCDFDLRELRLIEVLRTLRMLHYSAWLASRWDDPAFPASFPWFNTMTYWGQHLLELREQLAALHDEPLALQV